MNKTYAIVLDPGWTDNLCSILEPYLHPVVSRFNDLPVLYAGAVETQTPYVEACVTGNHGVSVVLRIPHAAIALMVETLTESHIGFLSD